MDRRAFGAFLLGSFSTLAAGYLYFSHYPLESRGPDEAEREAILGKENQHENENLEDVAAESRERSDTIPSESQLMLNLTDDLLEGAMNCPVFRSLHHAAFILRLARIQKGGQLQEESMKPFYRLLDKVENYQGLSFEDTRVLVVEGLAGSGKSTLLQNLEKLGDVESLDLPIMRFPNEVNVAESVFESMSFVYKSAFRFAKLYIMAYEIAVSSMNTVLLEEYYHSVFAHTLISHGYVNNETKTDLNACLFDWPLDLPQPTLVLYLSASADTRRKRLLQCMGGSGNEEDSMSTNLQAMYSFLKGPTVVALDTEGSKEDVCESAFQCLEEYGVPLRAQPLTPKTKGRISLGVYGAFNEIVPN